MTVYDEEGNPYEDYAPTYNGASTPGSFTPPTSGVNNPAPAGTVGVDSAWLASQQRIVEISNATARANATLQAQLNSTRTSGNNAGSSGGSGSSASSFANLQAAITATNTAARQASQVAASGGSGSAADPNIITAAQQANLSLEERRLAQQQGQFNSTFGLQQANANGSPIDYARLDLDERNAAYSQWLSTQNLGVAQSGQDLQAQIAFGNLGLNSTTAANDLALRTYVAQTGASAQEASLALDQWKAEQSFGLQASGQAMQGYQISSNVDIAQQQIRLATALGQGDQQQGWARLQLASEAQDLTNYLGEGNLALGQQNMDIQLQRLGIDANDANVKNQIAQARIQVDAELGRAQASAAGASAQASMANAAANASQAMAALRGVEVQLALGNGNIALGHAQLANAQSLGLAQIQLGREQLGEKSRIDTADLDLRRTLGLAGIQINQAQLAQQQYATELGESGANYRADLASATSRDLAADQIAQQKYATDQGESGANYRADLGSATSRDLSAAQLAEQRYATNQGETGANYRAELGSTTTRDLSAAQLAEQRYQADVEQAGANYRAQLAAGASGDQNAANLAQQKYTADLESASANYRAELGSTTTRDMTQAQIEAQRYAADIEQTGANYRAELGSATTREATKAAADQARLNLLASLRGPRDPFQYLKVIRGTNAQGVPNGIAALGANGPEVAAFQAPTGSPEAVTLDNFLEDTGSQLPSVGNVQFPTAPVARPGPAATPLTYPEAPAPGGSITAASGGAAALGAPPVGGPQVDRAGLTFPSRPESGGGTAAGASNITFPSRPEPGAVPVAGTSNVTFPTGPRDVVAPTNNWNAGPQGVAPAAIPAAAATNSFSAPTAAPAPVTSQGAFDAAPLTSPAAAAPTTASAQMAEASTPSSPAVPGAATIGPASTLPAGAPQVLGSPPSSARGAPAAPAPLQRSTSVRDFYNTAQGFQTPTATEPGAPPPEPYEVRPFTPGAATAGPALPSFLPYTNAGGAAAASPREPVPNPYTSANGWNPYVIDPYVQPEPSTFTAPTPVTPIADPVATGTTATPAVPGDVRPDAPVPFDLAAYQAAVAAEIAQRSRDAQNSASSNAAQLRFQDNAAAQARLSTAEFNQTQAMAEYMAVGHPFGAQQNVSISSVPSVPSGPMAGGSSGSSGAAAQPVRNAAGVIMNQGSAGNGYGGGGGGGAVVSTAPQGTGQGPSQYDYLAPAGAAGAQLANAPASPGGSQGASRGGYYNAAGVWMPAATVPSYAVGSPLIPNDQVAVVHAGEAVIPANQNPNNPANQEPVWDGSAESMAQIIAFRNRPAVAAPVDSLGRPVQAQPQAQPGFTPPSPSPTDLNSMTDPVAPAAPVMPAAPATPAAPPSTPAGMPAGTPQHALPLNNDETTAATVQSIQDEQTGPDYGELRRIIIDALPPGQYLTDQLALLAQIESGAYGPAGDDYLDQLVASVMNYEPPAAVAPAQPAFVAPAAEPTASQLAHRFPPLAAPQRAAAEQWARANLAGGDLLYALQQIGNNATGLLHIGSMTDVLRRLYGFPGVDALPPAPVATTPAPVAVAPPAAPVAAPVVPAAAPVVAAPSAVAPVVPTPAPVVAPVAAPVQPVVPAAAPVNSFTPPPPITPPPATVAQPVSTIPPAGAYTGSPIPTPSRLPTDEDLTRMFGGLPSSPHQIPWRKFRKLLPSERDMVLAWMESKGWATVDVEQLIANTQPGSVAQRAGTYAAVGR